MRAMPATNQVSNVVPLNRAARSLTSLNSLISLNSLPTARYHDAPKREVFGVRRVADVVHRKRECYGIVPKRTARGALLFVMCRRCATITPRKLLR